MDGLQTTTELARHFHTSSPRIHRAAKAGLISPVAQNSRGHLLFDKVAIESLERAWGIIPSFAGLSASEMAVAAALSQRPYGLRSIRQVALAANISPTTATHTLKSLAQKKIIVLRKLMVVEGRVKEIGTWSIDHCSPSWHEVAPFVRSVRLPRTKVAKPCEPKGVPKRFWHLFWDTNPASIKIPRHAHYVVRRIIESTDPFALAWLSVNMPLVYIRHVANMTQRVSPQIPLLARALLGESS